MGLWTTEHALTLLPAFAVMLLCGVLLRRFFKDRPYKVRMIPLQIIAVLMILLEIGKQLTSFSQGYDLYHIPLHFCSLVLFMVPIMAFYNGKHTQIIRTITAALCSSVTLLVLIYPVLIYSADNIRGFFHSFMDLHTVAFHNLVLFAFVIIIALDLHKPEGKQEKKPIVIFLLVYSIIGATAAQVLKTNYNNFYTCNVPIFETLRNFLQPVLGYWPTQILYIMILVVVDILFVLMSYWIFALLCQRVGKKHLQKANS